MDNWSHIKIFTMKNIFYLASLLLILIFLSCKGVSEKATNQIMASNEIENFEDFLIKFRSDSVFRNDRILYPLKGYNSDDSGDSNTVEYEWSKKMINYYLGIKYTDIDYVIKIEKSKDLIKETIILEGSGFKIISKYILKENNWYLNYYFYQNE